MAKKKFYAVAKGRKVGVYETWAECEAQTKGFGGALFKSFENSEDAFKFIEAGKSDISNSVDLNRLTMDLSKEPNTYVVYVDGSFGEDKNEIGRKVYASAFILIKDEKIIHTYSEAGEKKGLSDLQNVAGEIISCMRICDYAIKKLPDCKKLVICYDYEGIEYWTTKVWDCDSTYAKSYSNYMQEVKKLLDLKFIHTKGHSGIPFNVEVDRFVGYTKDCAIKRIPVDMDYFKKYISYFK